VIRWLEGLIYVLLGVAALLAAVYWWKFGGRRP
jgi:hypothetical protein